MKAPNEKPEIEIDLDGEDGNAFVIIGKTCKSLFNEGADEEYLNKYRDEAMSGDYENLLKITYQYVNLNIK